MQLLLTTTGTQSPVILADLGNRQFTHPTTDYNLLADYSIVTLMNSVSLTAAIAAGYITVTSEDGYAVTSPSSAPLFDAERIVSVPVDDSTREPDHLIYYNAVTGKIEYVAAGEITTGRSIYSLSFFTSSSPYVEYSSTSWQVVGQFPYLGSDIVVADQMYIVGSRNGASGTAQVRLWDLTNGLEIGAVSWASADTAIYVDDTLLNVPAANAVLELQVKKDTTQASKVRLHSMVLY